MSSEVVDGRDEPKIRKGFPGMTVGRDNWPILRSHMWRWLENWFYFSSLKPNRGQGQANNSGWVDYTKGKRREGQMTQHPIWKPFGEESQRGTAGERTDREIISVLLISSFVIPRSNKLKSFL